LSSSSFIPQRLTSASDLRSRGGSNGESRRARSKRGEDLFGQSAPSQQPRADALSLEAARDHEVGEQRALPDVARRVGSAVLVEHRDLDAAAADDPAAHLGHEQRVWPRVEHREALDEVLVHGVAELALGVLVGGRAEEVLCAEQRERLEDPRRQQFAAARAPDADAGRRDGSVARRRRA
tara:strand:- start:2122 stop:2661 length:540 start_codon:yes stop_codon:yes gene_type:complete